MCNGSNYCIIIVHSPSKSPARDISNRATNILPSLHLLTALGRGSSVVLGRSTPPSKIDSCTACPGHDRIWRWSVKEKQSSERLGATRKNPCTIQQNTHFKLMPCLQRQYFFIYTHKIQCSKVLQVRRALSPATSPHIIILYDRFSQEYISSICKNASSSRVLLWQLHTLPANVLLV